MGLMRNPKSQVEGSDNALALPPPSTAKSCSIHPPATSTFATFPRNPSRNSAMVVTLVVCLGAGRAHTVRASKVVSLNLYTSNTHIDNGELHEDSKFCQNKTITIKC